MARNQKGFGTVWIVISIVAVLVVAGLIIWRLMSTNQTANTQTPAQTESDSPAESQPTNGQSQADANQGYVVIKEWGVRFKPTQALGEVRYAKIKDFPHDAYKFTTTALVEREPNCSENSNAMLGALYRNKQTSPEFGTNLATIDSYYYQYRGSDAACGENRANDEFESSIRMELEKSLKTLEAAQ